MPVCHYLVSPGSGTKSVFVFVGCVDSTKIEGVHGVETEGEDIRPFTIPLQEAYDAIASGKINNGMTIIALQWLMLNKEQVRTKWF
jgi:ADP-ribose pyrophosphatase